MHLKSLPNGLSRFQKINELNHIDFVLEQKLQGVLIGFLIKDYTAVRKNASLKRKRMHSQNR